MASLPLISIITPSLNQRVYLVETMESVLEQDYPAAEYIVIDGGSTDGSVDVIRERKSRLAYWVSEPDSGQTAAINKGMRRAQGEIVAYLNSDDLLLPGCLKTVADYFAQHPEHDIVYGNILVVDGEGKEILEWVSPDFELGRLLLGCFIPQQATFIRRAVFDRLGDFREDLHYIMDYEYWLRAALAGCSFGHVNETIAVFRVYADSKSASLAPLFSDESFPVFEAIFARDDLPDTTRAFRNRAFAHLHWWSAVFLAHSGDSGNARRQAAFAILDWQLMGCDADARFAVRALFRSRWHQDLVPPRQQARLIDMLGLRGLDPPVSAFFESRYLADMRLALTGSDLWRRIKTIASLLMARPSRLVTPRFWRCFLA